MLSHKTRTKRQSKSKTNIDTAEGLVRRVINDATLADVDIIMLYVKLKKNDPYVVKNKGKWGDILDDLDKFKNALLQNRNCRQHPPVPAKPTYNCPIPTDRMSSGSFPRSKHQNPTFQERFIEIVADIYVMIDPTNKGKKYEKKFRYRKETRDIMSGMFNYLKALITPGSAIGTEQEKTEYKEHRERLHNAVRDLTKLTATMHQKKRGYVADEIDEISTLSKSERTGNIDKSDSQSKVFYLNQMTDYVSEIGSVAYSSVRTLLSSPNVDSVTILSNLFYVYFIAYLISHISSVHTRWLYEYNPSLPQRGQILQNAVDMETGIFRILLSISQNNSTVPDIEKCLPILKKIAIDDLGMIPNTLPTTIKNVADSPALPTNVRHHTPTTREYGYAFSQVVTDIIDLVYRSMNGDAGNVSGDVNLTNALGQQATDEPPVTQSANYNLDDDIDRVMAYATCCLYSSTIIMNIYRSQVGNALGNDNNNETGLRRAIYDLVENPDYQDFLVDCTDKGVTNLGEGAQIDIIPGDFANGTLNDQTIRITAQISQGINGDNMPNIAARRYRVVRLVKRIGSLVNGFNMLKSAVYNMSLVSNRLVEKYDNVYVYGTQFTAPGEGVTDASNPPEDGGQDKWGLANLEGRGINQLYKEIIFMYSENNTFNDPPNNEVLGNFNINIQAANNLKCFSMVRKILEIYKRYNEILFTVFGRGANSPLPGPHNGPEGAKQMIVPGTQNPPNSDNKINSVLPQLYSEMVKAEIDIIRAGKANIQMVAGLNNILTSKNKARLINHNFDRNANLQRITDTNLIGNTITARKRYLTGQWNNDKSQDGGLHINDQNIVDGMMNNLLY